MAIDAPVSLKGGTIPKRRKPRPYGKPASPGAYIGPWDILQMPQPEGINAFMRRFLVLFSTFATVVTVFAGLLFAPVFEHSRQQSPDGAFVAVVRSQLFYSLIPVMPGQGSDKPGRVTLYSGQQSCGSAWLPMISFAYDLRWNLDSRPRRVDIKLVATWNLDDCVLEHLFDG